MSNQTNSEQKYQILHRIDEPRRFFGLTIDECAPIAMVLIAGFFSNHLILSFVVGAVLYFLIRHLKNGQGAGWLINLAYWYLPDVVIRDTLFVKTPPSSQRFYIR